MNQSKAVTAVLVVLFCLVVLSGCTTVQKWAGIGASAGAVTGAVLTGANSHEISALEGAIGGAGVGGLAGALVGDQLEKRSLEELEAENENLRKQLEEKNSELQRLRAQGADVDELNKEIARLKQTLSQRETALNNAKARIAELEKQLAERQPAPAPEYTFSLAGSVHFKNNKAELTDAGKDKLREAARIIKNRFPDRQIRIEGHTDSDRIISGWRSNWELAAARALEIVHFLVEKEGIDPARICATSFGEYQPIADNSTEEGQAQNRRAVVVLMEDIPVKRIEIEK